MQQAQSAAPGYPAPRQKVYIVHGYTASPGDHWFAWLAGRLARDGVAVEVLPMPDSSAPDAAAWDAFLDAAIARRDADTFLVGHSLGCIAIVRHLLRDRAARYGGMVLVAGFAESLAGLEELDGFVARVGAIEGVRATVGRRSVIAARDDEIVPHAATERLAARLDADFLTVEKGGHFLGREGFTSFPLVYEQLAAMLRAAV
ncbi:RBBP9/YdeN family alpha/beta hydrolase [Massilia sp. GCM10023247]|uniref:RBBP9/YdeN family alpha/beta hydrolase n=1 Tax=Massilia sp. GCM10023247 TaxID=3252643 RepID=UPI0036066F5F